MRGWKLRRKSTPPTWKPLYWNLCFGYNKGQHTLQNVSFAIGKGEMVSIVGRNGAGKSTLSKLICGFETQDSGQIFLNGQDLQGVNIRRRAKHIGYVMQNPNQMISQTMIYDEVAMGLQGLGLTEPEMRTRVEDTLKICGLYPFRNWPISALSFGQKKRVTIASVLVQQPELILLDEPTAGQDFKHYTEIMEFLRGLSRGRVPVVMSTRYMHLMLEYTARALVCCDGALIADRSPAAVLCDPALVERAALKETSLYTLANRCGIGPAEDYGERVMAADRAVRGHGGSNGLALPPARECCSPADRHDQAGVFSAVYLCRYDHLQHMAATGAAGGQPGGIQAQPPALQRSAVYVRVYAGVPAAEQPLYLPV